MSDVPIPPRLTDEPTHWYNRRCEWLRQRPPRSLLAVYAQERAKRRQGKPESVIKRDKPPGKVPEDWRIAFDRWGWQKTADDWDKAEAERLAIELAEARNEWRNNELEAAAKLFEKGMTGTDQTRLLTVTIEGKGAIKGDPAAVRAAAELIERSSKLARLALDMPTSRTVNEFENMTTEALKIRVAQLLGASDEDAK